MRAKFLTTTNVTYWGTVLGSNEGVYVLLGLCRRNSYYSGRDLEPTMLWIKDLSVARHQAWRSAGKVVMLRIHEIILDQHRHQDWPKDTLHASYAHVAHMGYGPWELDVSRTYRAEGNQIARLNSTEI